MKPSTPQANINQKVKLADMSARYFEGRRGPDGNRQYRITCSSCGVSAQITSRTLMRAENIVGQFTTRKWMVGLTVADDLCPACVLRKRQEVQRQIDRINEMPKDVVVPIKAEQPRTMSRDDRRIIFSKLEAVYLDEKRGYDEAWTDERVSKDLGVPRAWVATVRDENFGPVVTVDVEAIKAENEFLKAHLVEQQALASTMYDRLKIALDDAETMRDRLAACAKNWKSKGIKAA